MFDNFVADPRPDFLSLTFFMRRFLDFWIFGFLDFWIFGFLDFWVFTDFASLFFPLDRLLDFTSWRGAVSEFPVLPACSWFYRSSGGAGGLRRECPGCPSTMLSVGVRAGAADTAAVWFLSLGIPGMASKAPMIDWTAKR
jgi:hypothetical protein